MSVGTVLQPSQPFLELALLSSKVEAELYINPRDLGFIRPGDPTTLKLDPYHFVEHGWVDGRLRWISEGTFITPQNSSGGVVSPGGTSAQGIDQASANAAAMLFWYIMRDLIRGVSEAMREP